MDELLQRLRTIDTTILSDAGKDLRVMGPGLRPIALGRKLVGPAVTVAARDGLLPVVDALEQAGAGDVLVIDSGGGTRALAGELFASEARRKGLAGIVIDGYCRDTSELRNIDLPFYARGCVPHAAGPGSPPGTPGPVQCGGIGVAPGDILVGDDDGIVVGTAGELAAVIDDAEALQATERSILEAIRSGTSLFERLERHAGGLRFRD